MTQAEPDRVRPDNNTPTPLWQLLQAVAACLHAVRMGQSGTAALDKVATPLRPAVQALM